MPLSNGRLRQCARSDGRDCTAVEASWRPTSQAEAAMIADEEGPVPSPRTHTSRGGTVQSVVGYGAIAGACSALVAIGFVGGMALLINEISRGLAWGYIAFCLVIGIAGVMADSRRRRSSPHA